MAKTIEKNTKTPKQHHYIRTPIASFFGFIAVILIFASLLTIWLNRTLTDTNTYVNTVAPLAVRPEVINFTADKITSALVENTPIDEAAPKLLKPEEIAGLSDTQLNQKLRSVINDSAKKALTNPEFANLWVATNQTIHSKFVNQLKSDNQSLTIDFSPTINGATKLLAGTQLQPISDKLLIEDGKAVVNLDGGSFEQTRKFYKLFQTFSIAVIIVALIFLGLSIWISTHHLKTLRRILISAGVVLLIFAGLLQTPSLISADNISAIDKDFALTLLDVLTQRLQTASLVVGITFIATAIASKLIPKFWPKSSAKTKAI